MNKEEAERRARGLLDYYGNGTYKGYEEITLPDGRPGIRATWCIPDTTEIPMSTPDRDTRFRKSAKMLERKISDTQMRAITVTESGVIYSGATMAQEIQTLISQYAYDLVYNSLDTPGICFFTGSYIFGGQSELIHDTDEIIKRISDMTAWPEQSD